MCIKSTPEKGRYLQVYLYTQLPRRLFIPQNSSHHLYIMTGYPADKAWWDTHDWRAICSCFKPRVQTHSLQPLLHWISSTTSVSPPPPSQEAAIWTVNRISFPWFQLLGVYQWGVLQLRLWTESMEEVPLVGMHGCTHVEQGCYKILTTFFMSLSIDISLLSLQYDWMLRLCLRIVLSADPCGVQGNYELICSLVAHSDKFSDSSQKTLLEKVSL